MKLSLVYGNSIVVTLKDYQRRPLKVLLKPVYVDSWSSRELTRSLRNPIYLFLFASFLVDF